MDLFAILQREWPVLSKAPWTVTGIIIASLALGWALGRFMFGERIATLKERVESQKSALDNQLPKFARKDTGADDYPAPAAYGITRTSGERLLGQIIAEKRAVRITRDIGASEADKIYTQVVALFREAGWDVDAHEIMGFSQTPDCGVFLLFADDTPEEDLHTVRNALRHAGIDYEERPQNQPVKVPQIAFTKRDPHWMPAAKWGF